MKSVLLALAACATPSPHVLSNRGGEVAPIVEHPDDRGIACSGFHYWTPGGTHVYLGSCWRVRP